MPIEITPNQITCVVLAGGLARRLGNIDKAFVQLNKQPLLDHVLNRIATQADSIIINANGDPARFSEWQLPVVGDTISGFPGPLAGVLSAMEWTRDNVPNSKWIASIPVDTPFAPRDLIKKMATELAIQNAEIACAKSGDRAHPVVGLWPVSLAGDLRHAITQEDIRKVDRWTAKYKLIHTNFSTDPIDPFFNINHPEDITTAEKIYLENN